MYSEADEIGKKSIMGVQTSNKMVFCVDAGDNISNITINSIGSG